MAWASKCRDISSSEMSTDNRGLTQGRRWGNKVGVGVGVEKEWTGRRAGDPED